MVCGVIIAMILVGLIIILVAVTINKLRKRETETSVSPTRIEAQQSSFTLQNRASSSSSNNNNIFETHHNDQQIFTTTSPMVEGNNATTNNNNYSNNNSCSNNNNHLTTTTTTTTNQEHHVTFTRTSGCGVGNASNLNNVWCFPPKAPTPNIYNCHNNDALLAAANDKNGFKGFRKQFSGRFKRLVTKKPEPLPVIPPELKPQLKTIYVY